MDCISWLVVGALGGWIASFVIKVPGRGLIGNIIAGIIGGLLVGGIVSLLTGRQIMSGFDLTSVIAAAVGAIVVSAGFSWFMSRGSSTAKQVTSGASNAASSTTNTMSNAASGVTTTANETAAVAGSTMAAAGGTMTSAASGATAAATGTASGMGAAVAGAGVAAAGMAGMSDAMGSMDLGQMTSMLNGVMDGSMPLDANSPLGRMITPIADDITAKIGLPKGVGAMVVSFALATIAKMMSDKKAGKGATAMPGGMTEDEVLGKLSTGGGIDTGSLQSMGLTSELATKTGLSESQASQGLEMAMGALSAGMSGQKTYGGMELPDMSLLTGMMK